MSSCCLLASEVSNNLIEDCVNVMHHFCLSVFQILALSFSSLIMMGSGVALFEFVLLEFSDYVD